MNWTGGRLQRHSGNNKNALTNRQKQHFAKVRTQLQHVTTAHRSPFAPDYLAAEHPAEIRVSDHSSKLPQAAAPRSDGGRDRQQTLDEFEDVAPVVSRLSSMKRRESAGRRQGGQTRLISESAENLRAAAHATTSRHVVMSQGKASRRLESRAHHTKDVARCSKTCDEVLNEDEKMERDRRRLLANRDWAGLALSRPLQLHFSTVRDRNRMGKRRRVNRGTHKAVHNQSRFVDQEQPVDTGHPPYLSGAIVNNTDEIRIRIGTDALAATQLSDRESNVYRPSLSVASSDPMLFESVDPMQIGRIVPESHNRPEISYPDNEEEQMRALPANHAEECAPADPLLDVDRLLEELHHSSSMRSASRPPVQLTEEPDDVVNVPETLLAGAAEGYQSQTTHVQDTDRLETGRQGHTIDDRTRLSSQPFRLVFKPTPKVISDGHLDRSEMPDAPDRSGTASRSSHVSTPVLCGNGGDEGDNGLWRELLSIPSDSAKHVGSTEVNSDDNSREVATRDDPGELPTAFFRQRQRISTQTQRNSQHTDSQPQNIHSSAQASYDGSSTCDALYAEDFMSKSQTQLGSASSSLQQIKSLAGKQTKHAPPAHDEMAEEDALWKRFVFAHEIDPSHGFSSEASDWDSLSLAVGVSSTLTLPARSVPAHSTAPDTSGVSGEIMSNVNDCDSAVGIRARKAERRGEPRPATQHRAHSDVDTVAAVRGDSATVEMGLERRGKRARRGRRAFTGTGGRAVTAHKKGGNRLSREMRSGRQLKDDDDDDEKWADTSTSTLDGIPVSDEIDEIAD